MAVLVKPLNILSTGAAPSAGVTSFADTFNRPSGPLGNQWLQVLTRFASPFSSPLGIVTAGIGASGAQQAFLTAYAGIANPNYVYQVAWVPAAAWTGPIYTAQQQFAQFTFVAINPNNLSGLGVYISTAQDQTGSGINNYCEYDVDFNATAQPQLVRRNFGTADTALIPSGSLPVKNSGDVWRLSADSTVAGTTTLRVSVNGVLVGTFNDTSANRLSPSMLAGGGVPGILGISSNQSGNFACRNFSCGIGL